MNFVQSATASDIAPLGLATVPTKALEHIRQTLNLHISECHPPCFLSFLERLSLFNCC